jgi:hypothetical protein
MIGCEETEHQIDHETTVGKVIESLTHHAIGMWESEIIRSNNARNCDEDGYKEIPSNLFVKRICGLVNKAFLLNFFLFLNSIGV